MRLAYFFCPFRPVVVMVDFVAVVIDSHTVDRLVQIKELVAGGDDGLIKQGKALTLLPISVH